jgi:hypothetical protein
MLAQIPNLIRSRTMLAALALCAAGTLSSCATKAQPQLVSDGRTGRESSIPWDKQESWETQGQFANMTDRR